MDSTTCWRRWSSSIPQPRPGVGQRHNEREARHLHFALLADFEPKGGVARAYGAYRSAEGVSERALFVIDKNGVLAWSHCSPITVSPGADGILEALERLQKGSFFPPGADLPHRRPRQRLPSCRNGRASPSDQRTC